MVKDLRVGPKGRMFHISPQSRTPSTDSEAGGGAGDPQGQVLRDSGEGGDNGRVEDPPNRRRHGEVGVAGVGDVEQEGGARGDVSHPGVVGDAEALLAQGEAGGEGEAGGVAQGEADGEADVAPPEAGLRPPPRMMLRLSCPRTWRCVRLSCQRCVKWAIIRSGYHLRSRQHRK